VKNVGTLIFGIALVVLGLAMILNQPRHFENGSMYTRETTYGGQTVKSETLSGSELNQQEPANNSGIRIGGILMAGFGGLVIWLFYDEKKKR
jgi:hypothetical protein